MKKRTSRWNVKFIFSIIAVFILISFAAAQENTYEKAWKAYVKKDYKTAVAYLKEYVEKKPDPFAYYLLGYSYYKLKKPDESAKYFREAYTLDPNISPVPEKAPAGQ